MSDKPWAGRFQESTDQFVEHFTASIDFDKRLWAQDIQGSIAHAKMLAKIAVLTPQEAESIIKGLESIYQDIEANNFNFSVALEDIHMNIEAELTKRIGDLGKKLHTGRSRNDQIATDMRLYLRVEIKVIQAEIKRLQQALINLAQQHANTIMPGFTHLQTAQPITFGHHMLAWFEMLSRDYERLEDCYKRVNICPLGSAALAGTSYPLDREYTASLLDFSKPSNNSLDSVSDRDFIIEFCAHSSLIMMHLSRMAEELIIWSSAQFDFVDLPDRFCTGSSIMPQKKNPDVPELVRGKTGRVFGSLVSLLTLMKAQPLAYNKDNQEDKESFFDTVDTVKNCLFAFADMMPYLEVKQEKMYYAAQQGYASATDLADYLVRKGIAFRDAHEIVGKIVALAITEQKTLEQLSLTNLQQISKVIEQDVFDILTLEGCVAARNHWGGTAPEQVLLQIERAEKYLGD